MAPADPDVIPAQVYRSGTGICTNSRRPPDLWLILGQ
jgi:hypothetical protein